MIITAFYTAILICFCILIIICIQLKKTNKILKRQTYYDMLTGLPNRALFYELLQKVLGIATRSNSPVAIIFFDINNFKKINDIYGHCVGDSLLQHFGIKVCSVIRKCDVFARIGGDEFIAFFYNVNLEHCCKVILPKLLKTFNKTLKIKKWKITISVSFGISVFPQDGNDIEELIHKADIAMYKMKKAKQHYARNQ
jgi:diguanylate cyclase